MYLVEFMRKLIASISIQGALDLMLLLLRLTTDVLQVYKYYLHP